MMRENLDANNVLLIDDDREYREMLSLRLKRFNYNVEAAANGESGIGMFEHNTFDIVITDVKMPPPCDGIDVLKAVKSCSSNTPVIMLSGEDNMEDVKRALRLGAYDYVSKAEDGDTLKAALDRAREKVCLIRENENYRLDLENKVRERTQQIQRLSAIIREEHEKSIHNKAEAFRKIQYLERKFRTLIDKAPNGFATISEGGKLTALNNAFTKVMGLAEGESRCDWVIYDNDVFIDNGFIDDFLRCKECNEPHTQNKDYIGPDNIARHIEYTLTPFELDDGFSSEVLFTVKDATLENEEKKRLAEEAMYDDLTGLIKQGKFHKICDETINDAKSNEYSIALVHIDLDDFKMVNTEYGHQPASAVLKSVGNRIKNSIDNKKDFGFRMGGDEFAIMLTKYPSNTLNIIVERLHNKLSELYHIEVEDKNYEIKCTFSVGVAEYSRERSQTSGTLYDEADQATYDAKYAGKGCFIFYNKRPPAGPSSVL